MTILLGPYVGETLHQDWEYLGPCPCSATKSQHNLEQVTAEQISTLINHEFIDQVFILIQQYWSRCFIVREKATKSCWDDLNKSVIVLIQKLRLRMGKWLIQSHQTRARVRTGMSVSCFLAKYSFLYSTLAYVPSTPAKITDITKRASIKS